MATTQTIINAAMGLLEQLGSGETPDTTETADCLSDLNDLIDALAVEQLYCLAMQDESVPMVSTQRSYAIGPTGADLVTVRPVMIENAYIVTGSGTSAMSYPCRVINENEYAGLVAKLTASTWPDMVWYQPTMPNGTLWVYPVPNATSTLHILTRVVIAAFAAATDTLSLAPGWKRMLTYGLAIAIAPRFGKTPSPLVMQIAAESKAKVKIANGRPLRLTTELIALVGAQSHRSNILTDQP